MFGKWLEGDLEDWFFMETSVLRRTCFLFPRQVRAGKTNFLRWFRTDPRQAREDHFMVWSKIDLIIIFTYQISVVRYFPMFYFNL